MAIVRLPIRTYTTANNWPNFGISVTAAGTPVGFNLSTSPSSSLYDNSDSTYMTVSGNATAGQGVAGDPGAAGSSLGSLGQLVPGNCTISAVRFAARARKTICDNATLYAFRGSTSATLAEAGVVTFQVTSSDFANYIIDFPTVPNRSPIDTTWPARGTAALQDIYNTSAWGLLVASDCDSGGGISVDVSELTLEVEVVPPTPVVVTGTTRPGPGRATLNGTVNPNQEQVTQFGLNGFVSLLFPVSWQFYLGTIPQLLVAQGTPQGAFICGPPNNNATPDNIDHPIATSKTWAVSTDLRNLTPGTTYYYTLAAIVDGTTTFGTTQSFTTPLLDPSFGAF